jgi:hypothetical protein
MHVLASGVCLFGAKVQLYGPCLQLLAVPFHLKVAALDVRHGKLHLKDPGLDPVAPKQRPRVSPLHPLAIRG